MPRLKKIGCQTPRIRIVPPAAKDFADGKDAARLCEHYWFKPDKWQADILKDWLARDGDGNLATITAGLSVPRQNGKNGVIEALELYLLLTDPDAHILHTAHQVKTCKRAFHRLEQVFCDKRYPEILGLVSSIRRTNGEEAIYLASGATIEYSARSRATARGFDKISVIVFDEAQELTDEQTEALLFTLGASETDRSMVYAGTPPDVERMGISEVFPRLRKNTIEHPSARSSWHEWSIEEPLKEDVTYDEIIPDLYKTNPALGRRLSVDFYREAFANMSVKGFAREALGWWEEIGSAQAAIPAELWKASEIEAIADKYNHKTCLAVKFSRDGSQYVVAGSKSNRKGNVAFEVIAQESTAQGTRSLAEKLAQRTKKCACVIIDGANGADSLINELVALKVPTKYVVRASVKDIIAASVMLINDLKSGNAKHTKQQALTNSALGSTKRPIGQYGGWSFQTTATADSLPIEAAALAVYAVKTTKRNPRREQRLL